MKFTGERYIPEAIDKNDDIHYEHLNRYAAVQRFVKGKIVLDAACGTGYGTALLGKTAKKAFGIDLDEETISHAKKNYPQENLHFSISNVSKLDFKPQSFDTIISFETIEHINEKNQKLFLKEIKRTLKTNGVLIISTPDKANYSDNNNYHNEFHLKEFYSDEFTGFLKQYFKVVKVLYQKTEVANFIGNTESEYLNIINQEESTLTSGKYLFAICSDSEVSHSEVDAIEVQGGKYEKLTGRVNELQLEVEEKNKWAFSLNDEIERLRNLIKSKGENIERLQENLTQINTSKKELTKEIQLIRNKEKEDKTLKETLQNKLIQAEESCTKLSAQLLQKEKEYTRIKKEIASKTINYDSLSSKFIALTATFKTQEKKQSFLSESNKKIQGELLEVKRKERQGSESKIITEQKLLQLKESLVNKEELLSQTKQQLEGLKKENQEKASNVKFLQSNLNKLSTDKKDVEHKLFEKIDENLRIKEDFLSLQKRIELETLSKEETEKQLNRSIKKIEELNTYFKTVETKTKKELVDAHKQIVELTSTLDLTRKNLKTEQNKTQVLTNSTQSLQKKIDQITRDKLELANSKSQLSSALHKSDQLYSSLVKQHELLQQKYKSAVNRHYALETEITIASNKNQHIVNLMTLQENHINDYASKIETLEGKLDRKNQKLNQSVIDLVSLQKDLDLSNQVVKKIKQNRKKLVDKLSEAIASEKEKEDQLALLNKKLQETTKNFEETESQLKTLETAHLGSVQRVLELQDEVEEKNNWAFALKDELKGRDFQLNQLKEKLAYSTKKEQQLINKVKNQDNYTRLKGKHIDLYASKVILSRKSSLNPLKNKKISATFKDLNDKFNRFPLEFLEHFSEEDYLFENKDVKYAVSNGDFSCGLEHFIFFGFQEIKNQERKLYSQLTQYNENVFLNEFPEYKNNKHYTPYQCYIGFGVKKILSKQIELTKPAATLVEEPEIKILGSDFNIEITGGLKIIDPEKSDVKDAQKVVLPVFEEPLVSIIVPAYNQANYTFACVKSILENTLDIPYEVILIDDNSPNQDAASIDEKISNIVFIRNEENIGFLNNCNKAASYAKGKYILFLNNDTNVQPNWLTSLVELIESDSNIGMVGSHLVYPDGRQQEAGGIIWNDASGWNFGRLDDRSKPEYNYIKEVDYISGAAIMINSVLWNEIGGFDERFVPAYYEDTDLAFEVRKAGYKVMYQPKSLVVHFEGISNGTDLGSGIKKFQQINFEKFYDKWKSVLQSEHYDNAQDVFVCRDRSQKKAHVLFVDHYLPHYDQDAGSKAAFQYLKLLAKSNLQVHFIGDNFWHYPDTPYQQALTEIGIEVLTGNWYANNWETWLKENGKYIDYVILSRPHISEKYIDLVKQETSAKVIYLGHDLHFLREEREYEVKKEEKYLESSQMWKEKELELIKKSDISYFFSDVEKSVIEKIDSDLNVNVVPLYIFDQFKKVSYNPNTRKDIMFVGGFAHAPNSDAVMWFVKECWPAIKQNLKDVNFYIIGSNPPQDILDLASEDIIVTGYINDEELNNYYNECKLAVAPLRFGAGVKGKVVDALYQGIPLITTSIGAEGLSNPEDFIGIANDSEVFAKLVSDYYTNPKTLKDLSKKSNQYCQDFFSEAYAKEQMAKIILTFKSSLN